MARWTPGAAARLTDAALDLYAEQGFERTTVADIAARAGVTERTFFRHFADKREVLFAGSGALRQGLVGALAVHPGPTAAPVTAAVDAVVEATAELAGRRPFARRRAAVLAASAPLMERELLKMADLTTATTDALRARGVADRTAALAAETAITAFRLGFEAWIADGEERALGACIHAALADLRTALAQG
jgi:AcrR family transcriptional regulator